MAWVASWFRDSVGGQAGLGAAWEVRLVSVAWGGQIGPKVAWGDGKTEAMIEFMKSAWGGWT